MFNKVKRQEEKMTVEAAADKYIEAILSTTMYQEYAIQRDKLLKQIIKDWYKDKISKHGMLSVNTI